MSRIHPTFFLSAAFPCFRPPPGGGHPFLCFPRELPACTLLIFALLIPTHAHAYDAPPGAALPGPAECRDQLVNHAVTSQLARLHMAPLRARAYTSGVQRIWTYIQPADTNMGTHGGKDSCMGAWEWTCTHTHTHTSHGEDESSC